MRCRVSPPSGEMTSTSPRGDARTVISAPHSSFTSAREVNEECGAEITVLASPLGLVEVISPDGGETRHLIQLTYPALLNSRKEPQPSEATVKETAWFSSYQIGELELHPPIADLLHSWLTTLPDTAALLREPDKAPPFAFPEPRWSP